MKAHTLRLINNQKLIDFTHWTIFGFGAASLALSVTATAFKAFFS